MTEGKVVEWLKQPGDAISKGDPIVVIESDKADMEVESFYDGFLGGIAVEGGGSAAVGSPIAYIAETEAEIDEAQAQVGSAAPAAPAQAPANDPAPAPAPAPVVASVPAAPAPTPVMSPGRMPATPAAKARAAQLRVDLATIRGTGPGGIITIPDVEAAEGKMPR